MEHTMTYLAQAALAAKAAREIAQKADNANRDMTTDERADFDAKFAEATEKKARHERGERPVDAQKQRDADVMAHAKRLADLVGGWDGMPNFGADGQTTSKAWAGKVADRLEKSMHQVDGQKAIVSGTYGVPNVIDPNIVSIGQVPTSLLDLIPIKGAGSDGQGGNTFTFLRQTVRTNNAAVVADSATKPTSIYTIAEVEERFRVIAHLSEAIPKRYFDDHNQLTSWLESEMDYGLRRALEVEALSGDGTGEHFTGILNTSGIGATAYTTDIFTTTRKAKTSLEVTGQTPTAYVFNPSDDEKFDLFMDGNEQFYGDGPFKSGPKTLWDLPRVSSVAVTAGTAVLADWNQAEILVREGATLDVDTSGVLFQKNQIQMRVEGRFGLAVKRPAAFTVIDLTA